MNEKCLTYEKAKFYYEFARANDLGFATEEAGISHEEAMQYLHAEDVGEMMYIFQSLAADNLQRELDFRMKYGALFALELVNDGEKPTSMRLQAIAMLENYAYWAEQCMTLQSMVVSHRYRGQHLSEE